MVRIFFLICLLLIQPAYANVFEHEAQLDIIVKELPELNSIKCKFRQENRFLIFFLNLLEILLLIRVKV